MSFDLQVNNAGTVAKGNEIEDLDQMLNLFVRAVFTITQRALPSLIDHKGNNTILVKKNDFELI